MEGAYGGEVGRGVREVAGGDVEERFGEVGVDVAPVLGEEVLQLVSAEEGAAVQRVVLAGTGAAVNNFL